jgi:hypothetical protein
MIQSRVGYELVLEAGSTLSVLPTGAICGDAGGDKGGEALVVMNVWSLEPLVELVVDIVVVIQRKIA